MELLRRRGPHIAAVLILLVALGATAYPRELVNHLEAATTSIRAGRSELAVPALAEAIALEPNAPELYFRAAEGSLSGADPDFSSQYLQSALEAEPDLECLWIDAAQRSGNTEAALDHMLRSNCPEQAALFYQEADRLVAEGDFTSAEEMLLSLLASLPPTPHASQTLGTLLAIHDPEGALSHLRLAVDLEPATTEFAAELMEVLEGSRDLENTAYTLAQVGQALARRGEWHLASAAFENALQHDPEYTEARAYYGLALDRSGQDGLPQLELAAAEAPQAPLPWVLLGKHWLIRGEPERAIEAYEQAALITPEDPLVAIDLGAAYAAAGKLPEATSAYIYATDLSPEDVAAWSLLAQFSLDYEIDLQQTGLPAARQAVRLQPRDAAALDRLGYTHFLLGNHTLAERFISEALAQDPDLPSAHYHLGLLALTSGNVAEARLEFATAVQLDPEGRYGSLARRSLDNINQ